MQTQHFEYDSAFERNRGWLSDGEQHRLKQARVAIVGVGGTGGFQANVLARLGVGSLKIVDPDTFELSNLNRQLGASQKTMGHSKASVIADMALSINPEINIEIFSESFDENNAEEVLADIDLAIDGIDFFCLDAKLLLFKECKERNIPALTCAPIGFGATLIAFSPEGMDAPTYFGIKEDMDEKDREFTFAFGLSPNPLCISYLNKESLNLNNRRASSVCPGLMLSGALTGSEAVKILTGKGEPSFAPHVFQMDMFTQKISKKYYWMGMNSPWMKFKKVLMKRFMSA